MLKLFNSRKEQENNKTNVSEMDWLKINMIIGSIAHHFAMKPRQTQIFLVPFNDANLYVFPFLKGSTEEDYEEAYMKLSLALGALVAKKGTLLLQYDSGFKENDKVYTFVFNEHTKGNFAYLFDEPAKKLVESLKNNTKGAIDIDTSKIDFPIINMKQMLEDFVKDKQVKVQEIEKYVSENKKSKTKGLITLVKLIWAKYWPKRSKYEILRISKNK